MTSGFGHPHRLRIQLAHVNVLFHAYQSAKALLDVVLVHLQRLDDDNAAFHLSLNHVDFRIPPASQRL